jgi:tripartite-type tricarboxylate transporter receptor subunit TctC
MQVLRSALAFACLAALAPTIVHAQAWPQKTVRFIVPLPPGSGMDLSARVVAEKLTERWGQPVVVENRQGADGIPAVQAFLQARDNHTFMFSFASIVTFNHLLHDKLPYDPSDIVPVAPVIDNFLGVSVSATLKVKTLAEFVALAKTQPGKLNYGVTPGLPVYVMLALQRQTGIELANIPYRDFAPAYSDLNTGRLQAASTGAPTLVPHHRAGTAPMLIVTNSLRSPQAPEVPTAKEAGFPNLTFEGPSGVWGWRDMAPEITQRVVADVRTIVGDPAFRARVEAVGTIPRPGSQQEFAAAVEDQRAKIAAIHTAK